MRRAATRKISRVKMVHGALVSGTEFDPRRHTHVQEKYTTAQLNAYKSRLADFLSRSNQFVPDASKRPLPRSEFTEYKRQESRYAATAGGVYERIKNVELPSGESIAQRLAKMDALHKHMHNTAVNTIFDPHVRKSADIASRAALRKLTKTMKQNTTPAAIRRKVKDARKQFAQMMDVVNMPELFDATKKLTNDQFIALWNHTAFAGAVSLSYLAAMKMNTPKEESWGTEMLRQQMGDAMDLIEWAKQIQT
jgi:hypothetical protein